MPDALSSSIATCKDFTGLFTAGSSRVVATASEEDWNMRLNHVALILGAAAAIILFGAFAVWLFGYLGQFVPVP